MGQSVLSYVNTETSYIDLSTSELRVELVTMQANA